MPRRCSVCSDKRAKKINESICNNLSYRSIALQFGMSHTAVIRHVETCLGLELAVIQKKHVERQAIDVYEEFKEQLAFAKDLRLAAREYLSDVNDPLKLSITPKAHEIEVTYFDHNDMEMIGEVMRPKKKTAQLSVILESMFSEGNLEPDKYKITTVDIRKFALDAINTTDTCIDKFAKLSGEYTADKSNPADIGTLASIVKKYRADVEEQARIYDGTQGKFGSPMPSEDELRVEIERLCRHQKVEYARLESHLAQELGRVG